MEFVVHEVMHKRVTLSIFDCSGKPLGDCILIKESVINLKRVSRLIHQQRPEIDIRCYQIDAFLCKFPIGQKYRK